MSFIAEMPTFPLQACPAIRMNNEFNANYSQLGLQIWAMIVVPLVPMGILMSIVLQIPGISDTVLLGAIMATIAGSVVLLLWIIKKHLSKDAIVVAEAQGLRIQLSGVNMFYPKRDLFLPFKTIRSISYNYDMQHQRHYLWVRRGQGATIQLMALKDQPETFQVLTDAIREKQAEFNAAS